MAAPTQLGQQWEIGFAGASYEGRMPTDVEVNPTGEEEIIKNEDNATATVITYDKGEQQTYTFLIKSGSEIKPPAKNTIVSLKGPGDLAAVNRRMTEGSSKFTRGVTEMTMTLLREESMAAAYDA